MSAVMEFCAAETSLCACDNALYKAQMEGLKQITATINSWYGTAPSSKGNGKLASEYCGEELPLQVLQTARGFYIGTASSEGPCSRESVEYFRSSKLAQDALDNGTWTQLTNP